MASTGLRVATSVTWSSMGGWRGPAGRGGSVVEREDAPLALQLEPHQPDPLRKDDQEAHQLLVVGDARPTLEEHVAEHGRPLDLEEEGGPVAQVPDDVHGLEDLDGALRDQRQIG